MATVDVLGPFQVVKRPLTLKPPATQANEPPSGTEGAVAWWKFDETEGTTAADSAANGLAGRLQGQTRWARGQGHSGNALALDGAGGFVDCGDAEQLDFREALTISAWFKVQRFDKTWQTLVAKGAGAWRLQRHENGDLLDFTVDGVEADKKKGRGWAEVVSKRPVADGQWHHVVSVYDGKRLALYLDGTLENTTPVTGRMAANNEPVLIGENPSKRGRYFDGWLDDVRLYGRALSDKGIQALYRGVVETAEAAK